jgi:predicted transglutaminase-like cysteine proteinase
MMVRLLTSFALCALLVITVSGYAAEYQPWSENVFLHNLIVENQKISVPEKLQLVNDTMNHLPWISDEKHWKSADYWATPLETITTFGGDCEDIAIAKWVVLNHLGINGKYLQLAYVKIKKTGENHMVLLYIDQPNLPPEQQKALVLDILCPGYKKGIGAFNQRTL